MSLDPPSKDEELSVARTSTRKYSKYLNITLDDSDIDSDSVIDSDDDTISIHKNILDARINEDKESEDSKERKEKNKRSYPSDTSISPKVKRTRLTSPQIMDVTTFRKSDSFTSPEYIDWLESNQHLISIKSSTSEICDLLDKVRTENPSLNKIFLDFVENGIKVNPHSFDIAQLVRPDDNIIFPPKWKDRVDPEATYVWSYDIPVEHLPTYCEEIEQNTSVNRPILKQFRNYLKNELPLDKTAKVFRWLYVGQTRQSPPWKRWERYYKKQESGQPSLVWPMCVLPKRNIPHRLVVVSSDGSENMEAVVAALLNIHVDGNGDKSNSINRRVCGRYFRGKFDVLEIKQLVTLSKFNRDIEMVECVHCRREILINHPGTALRSHRCSVLGLKTKDGQSKKVTARLFSQMHWCPEKDTCEACAVIITRSKDDLLKDLPLSEILLKNQGWKSERERLVLKTLDLKKKKVMCMHCERSVCIERYNLNKTSYLGHPCLTKTKRDKGGRLLRVNSHLFNVHEWCPDKANCKSCIQIVERDNDVKEDNATLINGEKQRHRVVLSNFDFSRQRIICTHCGKQQSRKKASSYSLNDHKCQSQSNRSVYSRLFAKMKWCPDAECKECLRIEDII